MLELRSGTVWPCASPARKPISRPMPLRMALDPRVAASLGDNAHALLLDKVSDIRHDRDQRISLSQMHVNPLKWLGMAFLGLLTLLSIAVVQWTTLVPCMCRSACLLWPQRPPQPSC